MFNELLADLDACRDLEIACALQVRVDGVDELLRVLRDHALQSAHYQGREELFINISVQKKRTCIKIRGISHKSCGLTLLLAELQRLCAVSEERRTGIGDNLKWHTKKSQEKPLEMRLLWLLAREAFARA